MNHRNTPQKELVQNAVQTIHGHVTADEVYSFIQQTGPVLGKGTIYRDLNALCDEGRIHRVEIPDGPDRFDARLDKHHHIHCVMCDRVFDADMAAGPGVEELVRDSHGFRLLDYDILIKGICPDCLSKKENKGE